MTKSNSENVSIEPAPPRSAAMPAALAAAGVAILAGSYLLGARGGDTQRLLYSYLTAFCYVLTIAIGGLFFVILQNLTAGVWNIVVRRQAEIVAATIPVLLLLSVPLLLNTGDIFPWAMRHSTVDPHLLEHKEPYLNESFFIARWIAYFVIWSALALFFYGKSTAQDRNGLAAPVLAMKAASGPAMVIFALTLTFAAFDMLMSLAPAWFSSLFGVYFLSSGCVGFFALLCLMTAGLSDRFTVEHRHELGKYLFGFIFFWGYIAFSQYLLIWYANIPEETFWYLPRDQGAWAPVSGVLILGHFLLPFLALVTRQGKRNPFVFYGTAAWMMLMHWVDVWWLIMPAMYPDGIVFSGYDIAFTIGMLAVFAAAVGFLGRRSNTIPVNDPRLREALAYVSTP